MKKAVVEHLRRQEVSDELHQKIPGFAKERFHRECPDYVESALDALLRFGENSNYVIDDGQIRPVDRDNTGKQNINRNSRNIFLLCCSGIVQHNMVYSKGLHQSLEIKHKLNVRSLGSTLVCDLWSPEAVLTRMVLFFYRI